ncbi:hypothetical protein D3C77_94130 [compost metagenome]
MVVPVFEPQERALTLAIEAEVGQALEGLRDRIALLEIEAVVIGTDAAAIGSNALRLQGVGAGHQVPVGALCRPTAAQAQGTARGEAPVLIDVEGGGLGRRGNRRQ